MGDFEQSLNVVRLVALGITCVSGAALYIRYRTGTLLFAVSGLHAGMFLFMGLGPFIYTLQRDPAAAKEASKALLRLHKVKVARASVWCLRHGRFHMTSEGVSYLTEV